MRRSVSLFGLCWVLAVTLPAAHADDASVTFVNRPEPDYVEYRISDSSTFKEITTLRPGSYTKVSVPAPRKLTIQLRVREPVGGSMMGTTILWLTISPNQAGKVFALRRSPGLWVKPEAVEEDPSDLSPLAYYPDATGILSLGPASDAYDRTYRLLFQRRGQWNLVSESSDSLTPFQRQSLYDRFRLGEQPEMGDGFAGWRSIRQGDWGFGLVFLTGEMGSLGLMGISAIVFPLESYFYARTKETQYRDSARTMGFLFVGSAAAFFIFKVWEETHVWDYRRDFNENLANSLDVTVPVPSNTPGAPQ